MEYVDGLVAAVPNENKEQYIEQARAMAALFKKHGALRVVECWGDDVPEGELTSFPIATQCKENETVVFSWLSWPSKEVRDSAWQNMMDDPDMREVEHVMPFDGQRMICGSFQMVVDE